MVVDDDDNNQAIAPKAKELTTFKDTFSFECDEIVSVEDGSDEMFSRARILFKNTYELSIVSGPYAFGADEFEVGVFDPAGEFATEEVLGVNNCVVGHLSSEQIIEIIQFVGEWKPRIEDESQGLHIDSPQNLIDHHN